MWVLLPTEIDAKVWDTPYPCTPSMPLNMPDGTHTSYVKYKNYLKAGTTEERKKKLNTWLYSQNGQQIFYLEQYQVRKNGFEDSWDTGDRQMGMD